MLLSGDWGAAGGSWQLDGATAWLSEQSSRAWALLGGSPDLSCSGLGEPFHLPVILENFSWSFEYVFCSVWDSITWTSSAHLLLCCTLFSVSFSFLAAFWMVLPCDPAAAAFILQFAFSSVPWFSYSAFHTCSFYFIHLKKHYPLFLLYTAIIPPSFFLMFY